MKTVSEPKPIYLLAGGPGSKRSGPDELLQIMFDEVGIAAPSIAYVGAASDDDPGFFTRLSALFKNSGAGAVTLAATASPRADLIQTSEILEQADLVFITGGDVEAGMSLLHKRSMIPLLRRLYTSGKPFFGLSAGSIILAQSWVRWTDPDDDRTAEAFDCLGFAPILCDMHAESDHWAELQTLLKLQPKGAIGYGIPSNAALRMDPQGRLQPLRGEVVRYQWQGHKVTPLDSLKP